MPRTVTAGEGLALLGTASLGPLSLEVPALLRDSVGGLPAPGLSVRRADAPAGTRHLVIATEGAEVDLRIPVLAPEIVGTGAGIHAVGEGALLVHAPFDRAAAERARAERPTLLVLGNARALWNDGRPFVEAVRDVRAAFGAAPLLWAPRVALPHRIPFLVFAGVDLVDTTEGELRAVDGEFFDPALGPVDRAGFLRERGCLCPACRADPPGSLVDHVRWAYERELAETRAAIRVGRLRERVESRLVAEPALAEMLRYADRDLAGPFEERTPVSGGPTRAYAIAESHRRPEMVRFRARLLERYRPPPSKSVLLLVPCSKTKPYRRSRSHRRFASALEGLAPLERVHVVSVSSPIGLVPRELEDVPPARQYDIPVTGEWTESERELVRAGLEHLLRTGAYRSVIAHLDPEEYAFLRDLAPRDGTTRWTLSDGRTTSSEALGLLRSAATEALSSVAPVAGGPLAVVREELHELASVQFGRAFADRLFTPTPRLAGRPWFQRLTDGRTDLATVREERGLFHLTIAGARRIGAPYPLAVRVDPSLPLTGDLFAPGVRDADRSIRIGDSVVLLREEALAGVGEAVLPGPLMTELGRGLAVRVRHRLARPTDTPMTEEPLPDDGPVV